MTVAQQPSGQEMLIIEAHFPDVTPDRLFEYWTQPTLLQQWWPRQAELEPRVGGWYTLSWPEMDWYLRGHYLAYAPGNRLAFTWKWDHDPPSEPERNVTLDFTLLATGGSHLRLTHGPYADTAEDQEIRLDHHLAGWLYFLPRLQQFTAAPSQAK